MEQKETSLRSLLASRLGSNAAMRPEPNSVQSFVTQFPGPESTPDLANDSWVHPAFGNARNDSYAGFERSGEEGLKESSQSSVEFQKSASPPPPPSLLYRIAWSRACRIVTALVVLALLVAILALSICIATGVFQHEQKGTTERADGREGITTAASHSAEDTSILAAWPTITASASASIIHVQMEAERAQRGPTTLLSVIITPGISAATTTRTTVTSTDRISEMRCSSTTTVRQAFASSTQGPAQDEHHLGAITQCERREYSCIEKARVRMSGDPGEMSPNSNALSSSRLGWF